MSCHVTVVIPVYNEETILHSSIVELRQRLADIEPSYEILIAENGSRDGTVEAGRRLAEAYANVRMLSIGEPNYGRALREGILSARGDIVICEEVDLCDTQFHRSAIELLDDGTREMVIGSKLIGGAEDDRPFVRHAASIVYTGLLRALLGFRGTDTHGLKAFRRERLLPIVRACVVDKDVFASELVIRAYRDNVDIQEIPIQVMEKRPPSINLAKRVPNVIKNLARLTWAIRMQGSNK